MKIPGTKHNWGERSLESLSELEVQLFSVWQAVSLTKRWCSYQELPSRYFIPKAE